MRWGRVSSTPSGGFGGAHTLPCLDEESMMALMTQEERFDELCEQVEKLAKEVADLAKIVRKLETERNFQRGFNQGTVNRFKKVEASIKGGGSDG